MSTPRLLIAYENLLDLTTTTVTATPSPPAAMPASNLQALQPGENLRIPDLTGARIDLDFGARRGYNLVAPLYLLSGPTYKNLLKYSSIVHDYVGGGNPWQTLNLQTPGELVSLSAPPGIDAIAEYARVNAATGEHKLYQDLALPSPAGNWAAAPGGTSLDGGMSYTLSWYVNRHDDDPPALEYNVGLELSDGTATNRVRQAFDIDDRALEGAASEAGTFELEQAGVELVETPVTGFTTPWMRLYLSVRIPPGTTTIRAAYYLLDAAFAWSYTGDNSDYVPWCAPQLELRPVEFDNPNRATSDVVARTWTPGTWEDTPGADRGPLYRVRTDKSGFTGNVAFDTGWRQLAAGWGPSGWDSWVHGLWTYLPRQGHWDGNVAGQHTFAHGQRYMRLDFAADHVSDYLDMGRLFVGSVWVPSYNEAQGELELTWHEDTQGTMARGGQEYRSIEPRRRLLRFQLSNLTDAEAYANYDALARISGLSQPVLVVQDYREEQFAMERQIYGYLAQPTRRHVGWRAGSDRWAVECSVQELLP